MSSSSSAPSEGGQASSESPPLIPSSLAVSPDGRYLLVACQNAPILLTYALPSLELLAVTDLLCSVLGLAFATTGQQQPPQLYVSMEGPEYLSVLHLGDDGSLAKVEGDQIVEVVVAHARSQGLEGYKGDASDEGVKGLTKQRSGIKLWEDRRRRKAEAERDLEKKKIQGEITAS